MIGTIMKIFEVTKMGRYMTYVRIRVYMKVIGALLN
jgi:hypothetical protein